MTKFVTVINGELVLFEESAGGGGGVTTLVTVTPPIKTYAQFRTTVTDALAVTGQTIVCQLIENDDYEMEDLDCYNIKALANNGSIDFMLTGAGALVGDFKIAYQRLG